MRAYRAVIPTLDGAYHTGKRSKQSFFEKKDQKAFVSSPARLPSLFLPAFAFAQLARTPMQAGSKSFLVLFLEKGLLATLACVSASSRVGISRCCERGFRYRSLSPPLACMKAWAASASTCVCRYGHNIDAGGEQEFFCFFFCKKEGLAYLCVFNAPHRVRGRTTRGPERSGPHRQQRIRWWRVRRLSPNPATVAILPASITSVARRIASTSDSLQPYRLSNLRLGDAVVDVDRWERGAPPSWRSRTGGGRR